MTDNEIIRALECCAIKHCCEECPYKGVKCKLMNGVLSDALDLINHQKEENKALIEEQKIMSMCIEELKKLLTEEEAKYTKCAKRFYKEGIKDFKHTARTYFRLAFLRRKRYEKIFDEVETDLLKEMVGDE